MTLTGTLLTSSLTRNLELQVILGNENTRIFVARGSIPPDKFAAFAPMAVVELDLLVRETQHAGGDVTTRYEAIDIRPAEVNDISTASDAEN
jgi:hypothetical protein